MFGTCIQPINLEGPFLSSHKALVPEKTFLFQALEKLQPLTSVTKLIDRGKVEQQKNNLDKL